ncbi:hypothetical protein SBY92_002257 [Candida maltosa Xu316]|uniref:Translation initiation factor eIF2 assembly protein n=1 Tax=Candida maltosa (strain Xu316) TaxID=1245528 RepID=M3JU32_CANMX|nr:hypothetical protein G210_3915 [Candida maltosa Xu316]
MTNDYTTFEKIDLTVDEILKCSYSYWSKLFPENHFPSKIIKPLPQEFLDYLASDSIKLPNDSKVTVLEADSDNEYSDWEYEEDEDEVPVESHFQSLHDRIIKSIDELGGAVFPKLNWSSPKDVKWIMPSNTIRCDDVNNVYLLLNSSDHIVDDLDHPFSEVEVKKKEEIIPVEYELVLTKWQDVNPALEFRVFVKNNKIIGVSQRDSNHYEFLADLKDEIHEKLDEFVKDEVIPKLSSSLSKYILDLYIPRPFDKVYIIDINPFSRKSDALLFTWNELLTQTSNEYEFRLLDKTNVANFAKKEYSESQVPIDVVGAALDAGAMIELAREWNKLQTK